VPCEIALQNPCRYPEVRARELRPWLAQVVADLAPAATSLAVRFISDREMRRLNRSFRNIDKTTDVLSFPGDWAETCSLPELGGPAAEDASLGDIVIAVPTARRQAAALDHPVARELRVLLLHGILHCLGYDHEVDDGTMERLERRLQRQWIDHERK
jgi:probable rRNA maturation factor